MMTDVSLPVFNLKYENAFLAIKQNSASTLSHRQENMGSTCYWFFIEYQTAPVNLAYAIIVYHALVSLYKVFCEINILSYNNFTKAKIGWSIVGDR